MSIKRYLEQLVDDVRESAKNKEQNLQFPKELLDEPPEHLAHLEVIPVQKVYKWMRIDPEAFPPAEQLSDDQIIYFCNLLKQLFEHYNYEVHMPKSLPFRMVYEYLVKALDRTEACQQGETLNVIAFCDGDETKCPFGSYCSKINDDYCDTWLFGHWWKGYDYAVKDLQ